MRFLWKYYCSFYNIIYTTAVLIVYTYAFACIYKNRLRIHSNELLYAYYIIIIAKTNKRTGRQKLNDFSFFFIKMLYALVIHTRTRGHTYNSHKHLWLPVGIFERFVSNITLSLDFGKILQHFALLCQLFWFTIIP